MHAILTSQIFKDSQKPMMNINYLFASGVSLRSMIN